MDVRPSSQNARINSKTTAHGRQAAPDIILSAIADEHRRAILRSLTQADETTLAVSTLIDRVIGHLRDGDSLDDSYRQRIRTECHHNHLPKLDACGMIVYDAETKQVRDATGELGQELLSVVDSYATVE